MTGGDKSLRLKSVLYIHMYLCMDKNAIKDDYLSSQCVLAATPPHMSNKLQFKETVANETYEKASFSKIYYCLQRWNTQNLLGKAVNYKTDFFLHQHSNTRKLKWMCSVFF